LIGSTSADGLPDKNTVEKVYDNLDFQRGDRLLRFQIAHLRQLARLAAFLIKRRSQADGGARQETLSDVSTRAVRQSSKTEIPEPLGQGVQHDPRKLRYVLVGSGFDS
jgi:hypothetical protein